MLTAQIAFDNIQPATKQVLLPLIQYLNDLYPASGTSLVESACWPDDLKTMGVNQYSPLHYLDLPVVAPPVWFDVPAVGNTTNNPWAISNAVKTLTTKYSAILDRAQWLRFLIHFVGDIHQPLHAAVLYSQQFPPPVGDMGGNLYMISGVGVKDLHGYWDSGAGQWSQDPVRPLNSTGQAWLSTWAAEITSNFPSSNFVPDLLVTDPWAWAVESNSLAWSFVYSAPQSPVPVPQAYSQQAAQMCQQRIALGGYRLAQLLDTIASGIPPNTTLSDSSELPSHRHGRTADSLSKGGRSQHYTDERTRLELESRKKHNAHQFLRAGAAAEEE